MGTLAYPVLPHRVSEALGSPRTGDEPDLHFGKPVVCGPGRQDHVTLPARVSSQFRETRHGGQPTISATSKPPPS